MTFRGWAVETEGDFDRVVVVHCPEGHEVPADGAGCPWCWKRTPRRILDEVDRLQAAGAI